MTTARDAAVARLLAAARAGDEAALGAVLDEFRPYLTLVAGRELGADVRAKCGASDLVQQTMLDAVQAFPHFGGTSEGELRAWLRRLLLNNLVSFTRLFRETEKRRVDREVALTEAGAPVVPSPSGEVAAEEEALAVRRAVGRLPEDCRQLLLWRFDEGLSFEAIGGRLGASANAARQRWRRAVKRLQEEMGVP